MKKLGRGWQYTTYDIGNKRVLKRFNSRFIAYFMMLHDCFPYIKHSFWKFPTYYTRCKKEAQESIRIIEHTTLESWMLANPKVLDERSYEQDYVTPLRACFMRATTEEGKGIIDAFVECNKILLKHSLIDRNFLITDNFGMNADRKIVLMDLGELYSNPKQIHDLVATRPWTSSDVVNSLPKHLRNYFVEKMDAALNKM